MYWGSGQVKSGQVRSGKVTEAEKEELKNRYNNLKKELTKSIWKSKKDNWNDLCEKLDNDIWGEVYTIATKKIGIPQMHHGYSEEKTMAMAATPKLVLAITRTTWQGNRDCQASEKLVS